MAKRKKGRVIDGIILVDKPQGESSNRVLQRVRRLYDAQKAGHTGNLDPLATGVLPVCLGEATKFSQFMLDADKAYQASIQFGVQTTTGDSEGEVLFTRPTEYINLALLEQVLSQFVGEIQQVPPMYSALKVDGQPLYKLARQGIEIERKARNVTLYRLALDAFHQTATTCTADITVYCSKGTYIRTLAEDIAKRLGDCGGHLTALRRIESGQYSLEQSYTLEQLETLAEQGITYLDDLLLPVYDAIKHFPVVEVSVEQGYYIGLGQTVKIDHLADHERVRIHQADGQFLGIGESDSGRLLPRRLVANLGLHS